MRDTAIRATLFGVLFCGVLALGFFSFVYERVLFDRPSVFNRSVRVTENLWGRRFLRFNDGRATQSASLARDPLLGVLPYVQESVELASLAGRVGRVLVVGMGGGSMGMLMRSRYPLAYIDLVEIDPVVVEAAELLGFQADARMVVTVGDGAAFVHAVRSPYDVVFLDAYDGVEVPGQFLTPEFFAALATAVTPDGVAISNVLRRDINGRFGDVMRGFGLFFSVSVFDVREGAKNCIVVASHHELAAVQGRSARYRQSGVCGTLMVAGSDRRRGDVRTQECVGLCLIGCPIGANPGTSARLFRCPEWTDRPNEPPSV